MRKSVAAMSRQGQSSCMSFLVLVVDEEPDVEMPYARHAAPYQRCAEAGATMKEIMEVLKRCIVQGAQARNPGVPILAEETAAVSDAVARP
jgi:hypothetical protein